MASSTIRISTDASRDITGLAGGADGRIAILCNVGSFPAVLKDESASSTAGNRFDLGEDITIPAQGSAVLRYDSTLSRWQCIGCWIGSPSGGITQLTGDVTAGPGSGSQAATIANGAVTEAKQTLADNTTHNVSITMHGYTPKAPNDATKFLDGTGAWDTVKDSDLSLSDITTNNATSIRHGFCPKLSNIAANRLDGTGAWSTVTDAQLSVSDVTSNNASTSAHGFLKKLDNDATHYMDGQGNWSVVPAASDSAKGIIEVAIQSEQETATSTTLAVTPGRQQYHPSAVKAWGNFDASSGTPTTGASYNVTSLTDGGAGLTTVNFTTAFSSANYGGSACCSVSTAAGGFALIGYSVAPAAASCKITTLNGAFGFADCATVVYTFSGDQ